VNSRRFSTLPDPGVTPGSAFVLKLRGGAIPPPLGGIVQVARLPQQVFRLVKPRLHANLVVAAWGSRNGGATNDLVSRTLAPPISGRG
jgi:hypothetical protein